MTIDLTGIVTAVLTVLGAIITYYVVPWIKENRLEKWISVACDAAELLYGAGAGDEKLKYAQEYLLEKGVNIDTIQVKYMIDAYVRSINLDNIMSSYSISTSESTDESTD